MTQNILQNYNSLSPELILQAIEVSTGLMPTGRVTALNSLENRVFEIEVENDNSSEFIVAKFYRPGRWTKAQILDEHEFMLDLSEADIPVVAPQPFLDGTSLNKLEDDEIYFTVFPKRSGRTPDEFSPENIEVIGRLLARVHAIGRTKQASHRIKITPDTYGLRNLDYLLAHEYLPSDIKLQYCDVVKEICTISAPWFESATFQRIHGDCHIGNIIDRDSSFYLVDFDDMLQGPCVQDLWLVVPGRDDYSKQLMNAMLDGYESFCDFDYQSLRLIEPLRALRFIHFSAWIAKRHEEPSFKKAFPLFNHPQYWHEQLQDLQEQLLIIKERSINY